MSDNSPQTQQATVNEAAPDASPETVGATATEPQQPAEPAPSLPLPTLIDLKEAETALRIMQQMLGSMHGNKHGKTEEYQEIMGHYRGLSTDLLKVRKRYQDETTAQARLMKATQRPAGPVQPRPLARPAGSPTALSPRPAGAIPNRPALPSRPAVTAAPTAQAAQAYGQPAAAAEDQAPAEAAAVTVEAAALQARSQAAQAYGGAATPAPAAEAAAPAEEQRVSLTAIGAGALDRAAGAYGAMAPAPVPQQAPADDEPPPGLPLAMPKFKSAMGPPSPKTVYRGPEVQNLQTLLAHLRYQLEITGSFDVPTLRAVNQFQKKNKIAVAQVVGSETRRLLNEMVTG